MDAAFIRNFAIIAHIDHGKSTLADRLLELTGSLTAREMQAQVLDSMDLERERGITIKAHAVRMAYTAQDGQTYQLNLIDTPGHVDFSYEVSRSLASCEGALLVVDASQGVEAQTLANSYLAINHGLEIIPVINKIDLPSADIPRTKEMIEGAVGLDATDAVLISAKTGQGVPDVLEAIVKRVPPPKGSPDNRLQALVFDSWFDPYRGVIVLTRVFQGTLRKGERIRLWWNGTTFDAETLGVLTPKPVEIEQLEAGEVGFIIANIKNVADTKIGDTITDDANPAIEALPGFEEIKPMVFAGLYTVDSHEHTQLREALEKLRLNDSSFFFEPESSDALGFGFRCGFLGLLHMEIIQERLEREFKLELITTAPGVRYKIYKTDGTMVEVDNPSRWLDPSEIAKIEEPIILATILTNEEYVGGILAARRRKARQPENFRIRQLLPRHAALRIAAERNRPRLLRPPQIRLPRLRLARLPPRRLLGIAHGQNGHPRRRRTRRRPLHHRPPRLRLRTRQGAGLENARTDSPPDVRSRHPGLHRRQNHRPRNRLTPSARTSSPNATAATSPANANCSKNKKKARSA